jgi:formylglycine-generating enzyme required for sulfatase activity
MKSPNILITFVAVLMFATLTHSAQAQCPADVNHDHIVDGTDLTAILSTWGTNGGSAGGDINSDGTVNGIDLAFVLTGWGICPGPTWATVLERAPDAAVVTNVTMRNAITASGLPWRVRDNAANIEMLLVPAGTFTMGCSASTQYACGSDESPTHQVTLTQAFYMGRYEVTQAQWTAKMGSNPSYFSGFSDSPSRPVDSVSWNMIQPFCVLSGLRLPTEAEWEYAYRAGTTTAFHSYPGYTSGTNDDTLLGNIAWYISNAGSQTHAVGGKYANALGLHDMSGNVWEWCQDWYGPYSSASLTNPIGPMTGWARLLRGGGPDYSYFCRASLRINVPPDTGPGGYYFGLRVVRTAAPEPQPTITSITPISGSTAGGTPITITGWDLTGATSVTVGGVAATSVVVVSSTSVTAVTPAGTVGAKSVAVTTPSGTASLASAFTYLLPTGWYTVLEQYVDPAVVTNVTMRNAITASGLPWRVRDTSSNIEMLLVPAGTFTMGCSASNSYACNSEESPTHQVTLSAFYIGRYEVTQAQWLAKMGSNPSYFVPGNGYSSDTTKPVEEVSWNMIASGFMYLTGLRLPTEAEWEYAYRAGTTTAFHSYPAQPNGFNDDTLLGNIAWYSGNNGVSGSSTYGTKAVGSKLANGLGLHDMAGNVYEWCQDWYSSTYYASSPLTNPTGPTTGTVRLQRGGSWYANSNGCRGSQRKSYYTNPNSASDDVGFRAVRAP